MEEEAEFYESYREGLRSGDLGEEPEGKARYLAEARRREQRLTESGSPLEEAEEENFTRHTANSWRRAEKSTDSDSSLEEAMEEEKEA